MRGFHALRHSFLSRLGRSGASPKVVQQMARHNTVMLTLDRYSHVALHDLDAAVNSMPALAVNKDPLLLRATGTLTTGDFRPICATGIAMQGFAELSDET